MFCGDSDMTFNVYDESQTALVGILAAWRCVLCVVARSGGARRNFTRLQLYVQLRSLGVVLYVTADMMESDASFFLHEMRQKWYHLEDKLLHFLVLSWYLLPD